jgi:hypothetical protein
VIFSCSLYFLFYSPLITIASIMIKGRKGRTSKHLSHKPRHHKNHLQSNLKHLYSLSDNHKPYSKGKCYNNSLSCAGTCLQPIPERLRARHKINLFEVSVFRRKTETSNTPEPTTISVQEQVCNLRHKINLVLLNLLQYLNF